MIEDDGKLKDFITSLRSLDGKDIGSDIQKDVMRLSGDEREAVISLIVNKYLKKEVLDSPYLEDLIAKHGIVFKEIVQEVTKREIGKVFGS